MGNIERQTLERERDRLKMAVKAEEDAIASGAVSLKEFSAGDLDVPQSRREYLLELQSRLAAAESRLALVESRIEIERQIA